MFSLVAITARFRWRISFTMLLVVLESLLDILYPLFIGWAVNDLIKGSHNGLMMLAGLGVTSLLLGAARRFYDTRIYSGIYCEVAGDMVEKGQQAGLSVSKLSARSDLMTELVEFFEQSMPGIVLSLIGLAGTLIVVFTLNLNVFFACLALLVLMLLTWWVTGNTQYKYHANYNQVLEQRVDILSKMQGKTNASAIRKHFSDLMRWNIKLSDLETVNFALLWLGVVALFISTPLFAISGQESAPEVGTILSLMIYVFDYSEKVVMLPLFIQQLIRLSEISSRLNSPSEQS